MTFMRESSGYSVGGRRFPACRITEADVERSLDKIAQVREICVVDSKDLRDGYSGMIVAFGWKL